MTKRTRTILFSLCVFLFILIAPSVVLYSQGYRFDFEKKSLTQTGGLFLKVEPRQAEIYIDGKLIKKTDFFFGSALIENLLPKKYKVRVEKKGFHAWEKTLEIKEKQVTEAKNILLIPENPNFTILLKKVDNFYFSPDEKKIVLKESDQLKPGGEKLGWALKIFELEKNVKSHLVDEDSLISALGKARVIDEKEVSQKGIEFSGLEFSSDSKKILLKVTIEGYKPSSITPQIKYFILDLTKTPPELTFLDFLKTNFEKISFNPNDSQKLILFKEGKIFEGDLIKKEISLPILENILSYSISEGNAYFLDTSGFLFKADLTSKSKEKMSENSFPIKMGAKYEIFVFKEFIFLKENSILYSFSPDLKSFVKFFEPIKDYDQLTAIPAFNWAPIKISPDQKKLVYFSDYEIWILFLKDILEQPPKKSGEKLFLTRFSEKIGDIFWLNSNYLIFNVGDKIKIAEIDERDKIQVWDFLESKNPGIFWDQKDKKLYLLSEGNLYSTESIIK